MLSMLFPIENQKIMLLLCMMCAFFGTAFALKYCTGFLPKDAGRDYAVDGKLTAGRPRGAGVLFIPIFAVSVLLFLPFSFETLAYMALLVATMLTGYLDDASSVSWSEYKKGLLDLIIAVLTAVTVINFGGSSLHFGLLGFDIVLPPVVYGFLAVVLVWASINVTNCADGVDGLSSSVTIVTLLGIFGVSVMLQKVSTVALSIFAYIMVLLAYLWKNAYPNQMMMGDAGSRAMGLFIAITVMKTGAPVLYLLLALVLILDGGLGLVKVSLKRFLKISILKNTRTPLHDHVRKNLGWSDTQCVFRFVIIQAVISACVVLLVR